ncbi:DeoR/GlpR family DNA-binding transcription regulator [Salibacterium aidingense]|uniref:DeoR/GlpR family DNA-binding transcription regulator n=1 Tax=Salibacterium aidingense TaxID=384933 RepID=UPI000479707E|nr:DeoR/GlpR family DNA-binding transcription regulator [Salibacterium aidingense]
MSKLFVTERRHKIMEILNKEMRLTVKRLAGELDVSEVTLRSDLKEMEKEGLLRRTHGGAMLPSYPGEEVSFSAREKQNKNEKVIIAQQALDIIKEGQCILLDASSTALELAKLLKQKNIKLTVVTSGIYTALELRENPDLTVILLGGVVRKGSSSLEGILGSNILDQVYVDIMFTSGNGFTFETGLTDFNVYEVELKTEMVKKATSLVALMDHSKIGKSSISSFARTDDISYFITDQTLTKEQYNNFEKRNIEVLCPVEA